MEHTLEILSFLAIIAVAAVLLGGLWNMMKGGNPNTSQRLMRMRVILQAFAIILCMLLLWFNGYKG